MPGNNLTTNSQIQCPHAGQAVLFTSNTKVFADGALCLLESDVHPIAGCPFTLPGPKYSPCLRIEWSAGATKVSATSQPVLVQSSIGKCMSTEGAPQGVAIIVNTQMKASST